MEVARVGYTRCLADGQVLESQRLVLHDRRVAGERIYIDSDFTGTGRDRTSLDWALAV